LKLTRNLPKLCEMTSFLGLFFMMEYWIKINQKHYVHQLGGGVSLDEVHPQASTYLRRCKLNVQVHGPLIARMSNKKESKTQEVPNKCFAIFHHTLKKRYWTQVFFLPKLGRVGGNSFQTQCLWCKQEFMRLCNS